MLLVLTIGALVAGVGYTIYYSTHNQSLTADIQELEADLGVMNVKDPDRVYFVAIEKPDIPSVIAEHVERVWQYRCYLPPNYDYFRFSGRDRVTGDGYYCDGSYSTSSGSTEPAAINQLITVSLTRKEHHFDINIYVGWYQGSGTLRCLDMPNAKLEDFVIEPVVASGEKNCSFSRDEIIPVLKIYDPASAKKKSVAGREQVTYLGALVAFCPTSKKAKFWSLRKGELVDETRVSEGASP